MSAVPLTTGCAKLHLVRQWVSSKGVHICPYFYFLSVCVIGSGLHGALATVEKVRGTKNILSENILTPRVLYERGRRGGGGEKKSKRVTEAERQRARSPGCLFV